MGKRRLIDADALREIVYERATTAHNDMTFGAAVAATALDGVLEAIDTAPTIDPESLRPVARLEPVDPESDIEFKCSKCEGVISTDWDGSEYFEYCPYCGARTEERI